ncbi:MAG: hypothetical protein J5822_09075 [Eubacteriaceae bacterium]|nr:hypothetical protein [Eubacteriaceae bacterium]
MLDRFSGCLVLSMSLFCPELIVSGMNQYSKEIKEFSSILREGGVEVVTRMKGISLRGEPDRITADMSELPELIPLLVIICATAKGACCISVESGDEQARTILYRSHEMAESLGADSVLLYDRIMIKRKYGPMLLGGIVNTYHDAYLAGACAVAGLVSRDEISLTAPESLNRVYPRFWQSYRTYGGDIYIKESAAESGEEQEEQ